MVKTTGTPEARLPSHLKLYKHENRWQTPEGHNPYTQISEDQARRQFPNQHKALKFYVHVKRKLGTKHPLKKVKGVAFYPKKEPTLNCPAVIDPDYDIIVLPKYKYDTGMTQETKEGKIEKANIPKSNRQTWLNLQQVFAIEHEAAHSEEKGGPKEDAISVWERTHKGTLAQAKKKYKEDKRQEIADKRELKLINAVTKMYSKKR